MSPATVQLEPVVARIDHAADSDLRRRVRNLLSARTALRRVHVDVINGVVFLSGTVQSFDEKRHAGNGCRRVAGVHGVENDLDVAE